MDVLKEKDLFKKEKESLIKEDKNYFYKNSDPNNVIIFLPGAPEKQSVNMDIVNIFSKKGYSIIWVKYKGSFDNPGCFLKEDPKKEVNGIIKRIKNNDFPGLNSNANVFLIGISLGGGIALRLSVQENIREVFAFSPLINNNYIVEENGNDFLNYLKREESNKYQICDDTSLDYILKNFFKLPRKFSKKNKPYIFSSSQDSEIDFESLQKLRNKGADVEEYTPKQKPHISFSVLAKEDPLLKKIFEILEVDKQIDLIIKNFISLSESLFGKERIISILTHGGWFFKKNLSNDIDFILVLDDIYDGDFEKISKLKQFIEKKGFKLDLTILYETNLRNLKGKLVLSTHPSSYLKVFQAAHSLYGKNIFKEYDLSKEEEKQGLLQEVGKYVDRLNRNIYNTNNYLIKKNILRILLSIGLYLGFITYYQSNFFNFEENKGKIKSILKKIGVENFIMNELFVFLEGNDEFDKNRLYFIYNYVYKKFVEYINNINIDKINLEKIFNKHNLKVPSGQLFLYLSSDVELKKLKIRFIACASFEKGNWRNLEENPNFLSKEQLDKLLYLNLMANQVNKTFKDKFGVELPVLVSFGDYGLKINNPEVINKHFEENKKGINHYFSNVNYDKLSDYFGKDWNKNIQERSSIDDIKELLKSFGFDENFINGYIFNYKNKSPKELGIIYNSIEEHIILAQMMIEKFDNSIIIYKGNPKKLELIHFIFKKYKDKHNNSFIGIPS